MRRIDEEIKVGEDLEINADYSYDGEPYEIDKLQEFLDIRKHAGATHVKLFADADYTGDVTCIEIRSIKLIKESDEDYKIRCDLHRNTFH